MDENAKRIVETFPLDVQIVSQQGEFELHSSFGSHVLEFLHEGLKTNLPHQGEYARFWGLAEVQIASVDLAHDYAFWRLELVIFLVPQVGIFLNLVN